jgi:hypothetical protein
MDIREEIKKIAETIPTEVSDDGQKLSLEFVVAERKALLSTKKLTYKAKIKIDDSQKELAFSEMLKESGFGLSGGTGGSDMSPGFGFKKETYSVGLGGERSGSIEEQSNLFGKKYDYKFDYAKIRNQIEKAAKDAGYKFTYKIW